MGKEGCFNILVTKSQSNSIGLQVQARFIIEVNIKRPPLSGGGGLFPPFGGNFFGGIGSITSSFEERCKFFCFWD